MSDLWIFHRLPAARVRSRHGGFNATFPMNAHTVLEQAGLALEYEAAKAARDKAERDRPPRPEGFEAANVLSFRDRAGRAGRGAQKPGRPGKRPGPYRD